MHAILVMVMVAAAFAACGREQTGNTTRGTGAEQAPAQGDLDITFRSTPNPPVTGENTLEVDVKQADGTPVTDATVAAELFMPAMPEMKMPEMRNSTALTHQAGGTYRGTGQVMMAGPWDVTVTVMRDGQPIGSRKVAITAR